MGHIRAGPAKRVGSVFNRGCTDGRRVVQSTALGSMENTYVFAQHSNRKARKKCRIESKDGTTLNIVDVRNYQNRPRIKKRKNTTYV